MRLCKSHAHLMGIRYKVDRDSELKAYRVWLRFHKGPFFESETPGVEVDFVIYDIHDVGEVFADRFQVAVRNMLLWLFNKAMGK